MAGRMFAVVLEHADAWDAARDLREQDGWDEHAAFMDALVDDGFVVLGGPFGDGTRVLLAVAADDEDAIRARLAPDPWHADGHLRIATVEPWTVLLDGRAARPASAPAPAG
jgi:uncharacterized protein YciI